MDRDLRWRVERMILRSANDVHPDPQAAAQAVLDDLLALDGFPPAPRHRPMTEAEEEIEAMVRHYIYGER